MVIKRMSTGKDLESRCPWLSVNEGNLRLRVILLLERVHCVKTNPPEGMDLIHLIKWKMVRGSPEHWQSLLLSLPCKRPYDWDATAQKDELNEMGLTGFQSR